MTLFDSLPPETQAKVKRVLSCYDRVTIEYSERRGYIVTTSVCLAARYTTKYLGELTKEQVFTKEEYEALFLATHGYKCPSMYLTGFKV